MRRNSLACSNSSGKDEIGLFVGGNGGSCSSHKLIEIGQGSWEREDLEGWRCFTAAHGYKGASGVYINPGNVKALLDSGAFSDSPQGRLSFEAALERQLRWEGSFGQKMGDHRWRTYGISSYDYLIDEVWIDGNRFKQRWSVEEAEKAVEQTVEAAYFLCQHRRELQPSKLFLGCQGVDATQYASCVNQILSFAQSEDVIALGGWCILGIPSFQHWLPEFHHTLRLVIPAIANAGIRHVHLYGVLWEPALAPFAHICHYHELSCSTDSTRPILDCKKSCQADKLKKAGARRAYWRDNVRWWQEFLQDISSSRNYQYPTLGRYRQLDLLAS